MREKFGSITIWAVLMWCIVCGGLHFNSYVNDIKLEANEREAELLAEMSSMRSSMSYVMSHYVPEESVKLGSPIAEDDFRRYTSPFGIRNNPFKKNIGGTATTNHTGVDIAGIPEARVLSVSKGLVLDKYYSRGWHNIKAPNGKWYKKWYDGHDIFDGYVRLMHLDEKGVPTGVISNYGHLGEIYVFETNIIEKGHEIGRINEEVHGMSTGPHLHFSIEKDGEFLPPFKYVDMPEWY